MASYLTPMLQGKRKQIVSVEITYLAEDEQGQDKDYRVKLDGNTFGAIIMDPALKSALQTLMGPGPDGCRAKEAKPPNSHGPYKTVQLLSGATDTEDTTDPPPECCYYVDGRWYCW